MVIISHKAIREFAKQQPELSTALERWYSITENADWRGFNYIKVQFNSVDAVGYKDVLDYISRNWGYDENPSATSNRLTEKLLPYKDDNIAIVSISYHDEALNNMIKSEAVEIIEGLY